MGKRHSLNTENWLTISDKINSIEFFLKTLDYSELRRLIDIDITNRQF